MTKEKHNQKVANIKENMAKHHLRLLKIEYARMLIKLCDGNMTSALNSILKAYGHEYGENKECKKAEEQTQPAQTYSFAINLKDFKPEVVFGPQANPVDLERENAI